MDTMPAATPGPSPPSTRSQRWLACLSFVLAGLAIGTWDFAGLGRRARLDRGILGVTVSPR